MLLDEGFDLGIVDRFQFVDVEKIFDLGLVFDQHKAAAFERKFIGVLTCVHSPVRHRHAPRVDGAGFVAADIAGAERLVDEFFAGLCGVGNLNEHWMVGCIHGFTFFATLK